MMRLLIASSLLLAACVSQVPEANRPCPCATGWVCCESQNVCVTETSACPAVEPDAGSEVFEERVTTGVHDLSSVVFTTDFRTAYGLRGSNVIMRIDVTAGTESEVPLCGSSVRYIRAPVLSLIADRFLVVWAEVPGPDVSLADRADNSGFIFDLAREDVVQGYPTPCVRGIYAPGSGKYLVDASARDGVLSFLVATILHDTTGSGYRVWLETWRYAPGDTYARGQLAQQGPFNMPFNTSLVRVLGSSGTGRVVQVGVQLLLADAAGTLTPLPAPPQQFAPIWVLDDALVGLEDNAIHWRGLSNGQDSRPPLDLKARMPADTNEYLHRPSVLGADQASGQIAIVVRGIPLGVQPGLVTSSVWLIDARTGALVDVPMAFSEGGREFAPTVLGGESWFPRLFAASFPATGKVRLETNTDNSDLRSDVAVVDFDGERSSGRFFTMGAAQATDFRFFSLQSVPSRDLEVRFKHDPQTGFIQAYSAKRGSPDQGFGQRTFLPADHASPVFAPDGHWLLSLVRDPVSGFVQLFRLKL